MRAIARPLILAGSIAFAPAIASAATCSGSIFYGSPSVTAVSLNFGGYIPSTTTPTTEPFGITVACKGGFFTAGLPALSITLSTGAGSFAQRVMTLGPSDLKYQLYTTISNTRVWGDGISGGTSAVTGGNNGASSQTFTGDGYLTARQWVKGGTYTDTIIVTVTY